MSSQEIVFSNSEMEKLVRVNKSISLKDSVCNFLMHRQQESESSKGTESSRGSFNLQKRNLWDYLVGRHEQLPSLDTVFKSKEPKRYIQVKT